jgi:hypothetical protein
MLSKMPSLISASPMPPGLPMSAGFGIPDGMTYARMGGFASQEDDGQLHGCFSGANKNPCKEFRLHWLPERSYRRSSTKVANRHGVLN